MSVQKVVKSKDDYSSEFLDVPGTVVQSKGGSHEIKLVLAVGTTLSR